MEVILNLMRILSVMFGELIKISLQVIACILIVSISWYFYIIVNFELHERKLYKEHLLGRHRESGYMGCYLCYQEKRKVYKSFKRTV